jgi:multisubunit Na+/H+ antiporter MnhC subunit
VADETNGQALPAPSEEIHLPEPAYTPVVLAFGITVVVIGVVLTWVMVAIGAIISLVALTRWIRQTREEMAELPLEH